MPGSSLARSPGAAAQPTPQLLVHLQPACTFSCASYLRTQSLLPARYTMPAVCPVLPAQLWLSHEQARHEQALYDQGMQLPSWACHSTTHATQPQANSVRRYYIRQQQPAGCIPSPPQYNKVPAGQQAQHTPNTNQASHSRCRTSTAAAPPAQPSRSAGQLT